MLYTCTVCGYSYKDYSIVHEHSYTSTVVEPTCTTGGYTIHTCECGDSYQDNEVAATGHNYSERVIAPTCTEDGYTLFYCACGDSYQGNYVNALGHNYVMLKCTRCGKKQDNDGTIPVPTLPPIGGEIMSAGEGETAEPDSASGTENDETVTSEPAAGEELTPASTIVTDYDYIYTGDKLAQMTVTTQVDDETPTTETLYFAYDASGIPMAVTYNGTTYYYVTNLQGDVVAILDNTGTEVAGYTYDAWGNILSTTGSLAQTLGEANPLRYRGYVFDNETGLYYLQSRYYDSELGRFINADALTSTGQGLLGNNMYTYCNNNPITYSDAYGLAARHVMVSTYTGNALPIDIPEVAETPLEQNEGLINGQANLPYADCRIGFGSYGASGCAYIATYNAMQLIGQPQPLALVTLEVFAYGAVALGAGGAGPWGTASYFNAHGIDYIGSFSADRLTSNISEGSVITFTAWYPSGWHAMTALYTNGEYWVFNRYNEDVKHATYSSLSDAYSNGWWIYGFRIDP